MKISQLKELGLRQKTLDELHVSVGDVITDDEFNKPLSTDYRNAAIDRLVDLRVNFVSNCNIAHDILKRFVKVQCPYCGGKTEGANGSGNGTSCSLSYVCLKCESIVNLSTFNDGVSFYPTAKDAK